MQYSVFRLLMVWSAARWQERITGSYSILTAGQLQVCLFPNVVYVHVYRERANFGNLKWIQLSSNKKNPINFFSHITHSPNTAAFPSSDLANAK